MVQASSKPLTWTSRNSDLAALLVSGVAAAAAPLQVFLLAYIVLGPMHYLTEIAWLRKKSFYFDKGVISPRGYGILAALLALAGAVDFVTKRGLGFWLIGGLLLLSLSVWIGNRYILMAIAVAGVAAKVFSPGTVFFVGVVTPTIVHVFFFTWIFMVSGAIRARDSSPNRWLNPALMLLIPLALLRLPIRYPAPGSPWLRMESISFGPFHQLLAAALHHPMSLGADITADPVVAALLRLFAFAYLFHYLNWFGKTDLLGWHRIPARTWSVIGVLYAASLSLYLWSFTVGFMVANFLSLLHVLMEFPLDWTALRFVASGWRRPPAPLAIVPNS